MEKMVRSYDDKRCWRYTGNGMSYLSLYVFSNIGYLSISDIDIEPGVKEARFICPDGETAVVFLLEKCMKQFPDIEKIYIGSGVKSLHFSNFMFPNVKYVESDNKSFLSGQMLVSRGGSLYNVFCRKPEDVIDLNKVIFIEDKAFAGCMSTNIINTDNVSLVDSMAFDGSAVSMLDFKNGVVMVGNNIIVDVSEDADEIVLPRDCVVSHAIEKRHLKKAVIKDMKMLSAIQLNADTIVIDDDNERVRKSLAKYGLTYAKTIELTEKTRSLGYIDVDGIVYSADRKTLLVCPGRRTKPVNIPEGTEVISAFAFADSMIESVSMPDSLKRIEQHAFNGCKCLMHVDIGKGLTNLGEPFSSGAMFNGCRSLQYIDIPENIKYISSNCFSNSGLTSVTLHEGLETIDSGAFNCSIQNVEIPKSVKNIDLWNFPMLDEANIKTHSMPAITSIVKSNCKKWNCRSNMADLKINIDCMAYPVFVPAKLTSAGLRRLNSLLNKALFRDTDSDDVNRTTFLSITSNPRIKQRLALKMYDAVECNEIKTYLRRAGKSIAEWMILDKDEGALIQFLKKDIITANTIDKLIPQMDAAEMINAKAYALEYIRKSTKEKSFRI